MSEITRHPHLNRILVVDDTSANLQLLTSILTEQGYSVHPASDGELALRFVQSIIPDLLLLDIRLPGIDGFEVCRRLKADERTASIPIIFISILEDERDKVKGFQAGAVDYITKPFQPEEVLARVETHLRLRELTVRLEEEVRERTEEMRKTNQRLQQELAERKTAQMQILANEKLFRALVENSPDFIARYDLEFRRTYVNPAIQRLFGNPAEDVLNKAPDGQSPVHAPQVYVDQLRQVVETASERAIEMPFRTAQGEMHWGHMRFIPEYGPDGKVASVLAIGRDVHEIKENERRFRMLAENYPDAVVRFDRDCRHTYVNPAVEKAFGLPAEAFIGKTLQELPSHIDPEQNHKVSALIRRAFDEAVANDSEASWDTLEGKRVYKIRHVPEKDAAGNVVSVLGIAHDITERKQAEAEIRSLNQELEQRVADRTSKFKQANKELEAFAYSVSHDLRAPLRHIDGFMGLLQKKAGTTLDEQGRHYMDTIANAAQKMGRLIDDLLSFSRMGRRTMAFQPVELGTLVHAVIQELEPDSAGRNIEWHIGDLPVVSGDAPLLRMVLVNLISNALKFTRPRQQARIEIGSIPNQDAEVVIFVRDNGVGFDVKYVDKLFGVFQRLHRADEFEGSGIGLANVHRIIARHGGRTWAEGQLDQGAAFYFALPLIVQGGGYGKP